MPTKEVKGGNEGERGRAGRTLKFGVPSSPFSFRLPLPTRMRKYFKKELHKYMFILLEKWYMKEALRKRSNYEEIKKQLEDADKFLKETFQEKKNNKAKIVRKL